MTTHLTAANSNTFTVNTSYGGYDGTGGQWDNGNWYQPWCPAPTPQPLPVYIPTPVYVPTYMPPIVIKEEKMEEKMFIYEVIVVDKKECKVLTNQTAVAKDKQSAMLELDLTPEMKALNKKGEIEFIFIEKGSFNKIEKKTKDDK